MIDRESKQDREIARRFSSMRAADARMAPECPDAQALAQRRPLVAKARYSPVFSRLAAAVVLVLFVGFLTLDRSPRDPGALYADIMSDSYLMTDSLMTVSAELSPETIDTMGALDIELSLMELN